VDLWELEARESIRHTIASYTYFADRGRFDDAIACFTPDGALVIEGIGGATSIGRPAIFAFFSGVHADVETTRPTGRMQHHVSSTWIEVASEGEARAASYFTVMTGAGVDHWGTYRDEFVPHEGRWRFKLRTVRTDGVTPGGWAASRR
jgi:SnoaL-like protein